MASSAQPSVNSNALDDEASTLRATYAGAKRRIAALEQQIQILQDGGPKKKS